MNNILVNRAYKLLLFIILFSYLYSNVITVFYNIDFSLFYISITTAYLLLLLLALNTINSFFVKAHFIFWYFGYFLSLFLIYDKRDEYIYGTWKSVGDFDFSMNGFIDSYLMIFYFFLLFYIVSFFLDKVFHIKKFKYFHINNFKKYKIEYNKNTALKYFVYLIIIILFQFVINEIMYSYKIGIMVTFAERLPFKLSGFLYYYRLLFYPLIVIYLIYKIKDLKHSFLIVIFILILLEVLQVGYVSLSKKMIFLHSLGLFYLLFYRKYYFSLSIFTILILFLTVFVSIIRIVYYQASDMQSIFEQSVFDVLSSDYILGIDYHYFDLLKYSIEVIIMRFLGIKEFLMTQYCPVGYKDLSYFFYTNFQITYFGVPQIGTQEFLGITLDGESKKSIGLDIISKIFMSTTNIQLLTLFISMYSFVIILFEKIFQKIIFKSISNEIIIYFMYLIIGTMFYFRPSDAIKMLGVMIVLHILIKLLIKIINVLHRNKLGV